MYLCFHLPRFNRDETLAKIAALTPEARHLEGLGVVEDDTEGLEAWLRRLGAL